MGERIEKAIQTSELTCGGKIGERVEQEGNTDCSSSQMEMQKRRRLKAKQQRQINREQLVKLIEDQEYRCKLSGIELTPNTASLDHVIPVSKGGEHVVSNVVWVHSEINRMKGQLPVEEFVSLCSKVAQYSR